MTVRRDGRMTPSRLWPKQIALAQLETALQLYLGRRDLVSAITLAGAAEEILAALLRRRGRTPSLVKRARRKRTLFRSLWPNAKDPGLTPFVDLSNRPRNALKHLTTTRPLSLDLNIEATRMLTRAVENYLFLYRAPTPAMLRFQRQRLARLRTE
jgi:hypothetical protein